MTDPNPALSRRQWLRTTAAGAAGGAMLGCVPPAAAAMATATPATASAGSATPVTTPAQALQRLMEGNARFVRGASTTPNATAARLQELAQGQAPFASILACADSRVPVEIVFDQGVGDLFVCRAAGNIATSELIGSLEYGTLVLGSQLIMVLGHTGCGAVTATVKGDAVPGQIGSLYPYIYPAIQRAGDGDLDAVIAQNVLHQVELLRHASPVAIELAAAGRLRVAGAVLNFRDGTVTILDDGAGAPK